MIKMKSHPAADAFPLMADQRYAELRDSIKANGQRKAITIQGGMILDGRNRYRACLELGIEPRTEEYDGNPWQYVWDLNGNRRDLQSDEQRYLIWKFCNEKSDAWLNAQKKIRDEANQKRSDATKEQHAVSNPRAGEKSGSCTERTTTKTPVSRVTAAASANVNMGAVARGDALIKARPDLAEKVRDGSIKPADAFREMKRESIVERLENIEAKKVKAAEGVYDVIVLDPPWPMVKIERDVRPNQSEFDYPTMTEEAMATLKIPSANDCHVWVWTTHKFLPMAFRLLDNWGLKYVCTFVWHKPGGFQPIGLPQYNCEFALYARRGSPPFVDTKALPTCFEAPRGAHSEKPEEFYDVVRRVTAGRRLDMFNRREIPGFDGWGNEA
jgi:N6-adenosine-specific RNA methylase IME4